MTGIGPFWLDPNDKTESFPDVSLALREPNGLLAVGGALTSRRLLNAYMQGIFPWYNQGQPVLWWCPDPRAVLFPSDARVSRSMRKEIRKGAFKVTADTAFQQVIRACAAPRANSHGTWITQDVIDAYTHLHNIGLAHSVETWHHGQLVGGLYGISLGKVFFGESMFSHMTNASKIAFIYLVHELEAWGYDVVDCQIQSAHLRSLGSRDIPRREFISILNRSCFIPRVAKPWRFDHERVLARYT